MFKPASAPECASQSRLQMIRAYPWMAKVKSSAFCVVCGRPSSRMCPKCSTETVHIFVCDHKAHASATPCVDRHSREAITECAPGLISKWRLARAEKK